MTTTAYAGFDGSIAGPSGFTEVKSWKADLQTADLDATSMASLGFSESVEGLQSGTVSATVQGTALPSRGISAITLKTKSTGGLTITGSALISRVSVNDPVDGLVSADVEAKMTGSFSVA